MVQADAVLQTLASWLPLSILQIAPQALGSAPGIFIITLPAFAFVYARMEDNLQRFIFGFGGLLMVVYVLFSSIGDISATAVFFGGKACFIEIEHMYAGTPTGTQINSVLHTVSNSAMLGYAVIFFKEAGKYLKIKRETI